MPVGFYERGEHFEVLFLSYYFNNSAVMYATKMRCLVCMHDNLQLHIVTELAENTSWLGVIQGVCSLPTSYPHSYVCRQCDRTYMTTKSFNISSVSWHQKTLLLLNLPI